MTKFEFIAVLLSIIFGLGLTNLLSGLLQAYIRRELTDTRLAWSILVANLLLVDNRTAMNSNFVMGGAGIYVAFAFFILMSIAALTSSISMLEVPVAYAVENHGIEQYVGNQY